MEIKIIPCGILKTNCYVLSDETGEGVIIDPGAESDAILGYVREAGIRVRYIINTHGHWDHIGANIPVAEETGAPILIHELDKAFLDEEALNLSKAFGVIGRGGMASQCLSEEDVLTAGEVCLRVLHTPGHTQGSISLVADGMIFTGDALFKGSIGRTDLPTGSTEVLMEVLAKKILTFPDDTVVYPGHGKATTIGAEKENNPYIRF